MVIVVSLCHTRERVNLLATVIVALRECLQQYLRLLCRDLAMMYNCGYPEKKTCPFSAAIAESLADTIQVSNRQNDEKAAGTLLISQLVSCSRALTDAGVLISLVLVLTFSGATKCIRTIHKPDARMKVLWLRLHPQQAAKATEALQETLP